MLIWLSFIVTGWPVFRPGMETSSLSERLVQSGRAEKSGATVTNHFVGAMRFCIPALGSNPPGQLVAEVVLHRAAYIRIQTDLAYQTHVRV